MGDKATICDVMEWAIPLWSPNLIMPTRWTEDHLPPEERGPFFIVHCGDRDTALHVCELLNEECDRVIRTADDPAREGDAQ